MERTEIMNEIFSTFRMNNKRRNMLYEFLLKDRLIMKEKTHEMKSKVSQSLIAESLAR